MLNTNTSQNTVNNIESNKNEKDISVDWITNSISSNWAENQSANVDFSKITDGIKEFTKWIDAQKVTEIKNKIVNNTMIISVLFMIWLSLPISLMWSVHFIVLDILLFIFIILSGISYIAYLNKQFNFLDKINVKNDVFDVIKSIDKKFLLFVILIITIVVWDIVLFSSMRRQDFYSFFIANLFQIHLITLAVITYIDLGKMVWIISEIDKLKTIKGLSNIKSFDKITLSLKWICSSSLNTVKKSINDLNTKIQNSWTNIPVTPISVENDEGKSKTN
jgi:hypothetical protein